MPDFQHTLLSIPHIRERIGAFAPDGDKTRQPTRRAAVSLVLRRTGNHTEALFILRATKQGDPWSGHMAFPGGHHEVGDVSLRHTAERETREEIGLDLSQAADWLGQLDSVTANPRGGTLNMVVTPFVYELKEPNDGLSLGLSPNHEVAGVFWSSLNEMHSGTTHTTGEFLFTARPRPIPVTAWGVRWSGV